jgi:hypothetical protein
MSSKRPIDIKNKVERKKAKKLLIKNQQIIKKTTIPI